MKIISKTITTIVVMLLLSVMAISIVAYVSMHEIEKETSERAVTTLSRNEERKLENLALEKANFTNSVLSEMESTTKIIGSMVKDLRDSSDSIDGYWTKEKGLFSIKGDVDCELNTMTSGNFYTYINGSFGDARPSIVMGDGSRMSGNLTFLTGNIYAEVNMFIRVSENIYLNGTLDGEKISLSSEEMQIVGWLNADVYGDDIARDSGILVRGNIQGWVEGSVTGPVVGLCKGTVDALFTGSFQGDVDAEISRSPQQIDTFLKNIDNTYEIIDSAYFGGTEITMTLNEDQSIFIGPSLGFHGFNATKRDWFIQARETRKTFFSEPYIDATGLGLMITVSSPVYDNTGRFIGVAGVDATIQSILDSLLTRTSYETASTYLIDNDGDLIATENLSIDGEWTDKISTENFLETSNPQFRVILENALDGNHGIAGLVIKGNDEDNHDSDENRFRYGPTVEKGEKLIAYSPVKATGWTLLLVVEKDEIIAPSTEISDVISDKGRDIGTSFFIISFLILAFGGLIGSFVGYNIIRPLRDLSSSVRKIDPGRLQEKTDPLIRDDEIGELSLAFSGLTERMISYRQDLQDEIHERKTKEQESENERKRAEFYLDLLSHDIGNLHQGIHTSLILSQMDGGTPEQKQRSLNIAHESVKRSMALVKNIILLSKVRHSNPVLEKIDVLEKVREAKSQVASMFPAREIKINIHSKDKKVIILAEPIVEQMLWNLLHNGIKYQMGDKATLDIYIDSNKQSGTVTVDIIDQGSGIPDKNKDMVFERFESTSSKQKKGTGLGLHLVKELAERYNAKIKIMDRVKGDHTKGTVFRITFLGEVFK